MADERLRRLERAAAGGDPEAVAALRLARIRHGLEKLPEVRYTVLELNLTSLEKKVASLAKRAVRLGHIPLTLWVSDERQWVERPNSPAPMAYREVAVIGDAPDTGKWEWIARLNHKVPGTVIQRQPRASMEERELVTYRDRGPVCDHCNVRRKRNDTYVLRHRESQEVVQVGRTCLEQFLGCSPSAALYAFDAEADLNEFVIRSGELQDGAVPEYGVPAFQFLARFVQRCRIDARGEYRRWEAVRAWHAALDDVRHINGRPEDVTAEDAQEATAALARFAEEMLPKLNAEDQPLSDRDHNLAATIAEGTIPERHAEIAAQLIGWHRGRCAEERRAEELAKPAEQRLADALVAAGFEASLVTWGGEPRIALDVDGLTRLLTATEAGGVKLASLRSAALRVASAEAGVEEPLPQGQYLGRKGETGRWILRVERVTHAAVDLVHGSGRKAVWFRSNGSLPDGMRRGATVAVEATVAQQQNHRHYGRKSVLSDLRVVAVR